MHATRHVTLSVGRSVGWLVGCVTLLVPTEKPKLRSEKEKEKKKQKSIEEGELRETPLAQPKAKLRAIDLMRSKRKGENKAEYSA